MASPEIALLEHEWRNLILVIDFAKKFCDVDFEYVRKDGITQYFHTNFHLLAAGNSKNGKGNDFSRESSFLRKLSMERDDSRVQPPPVVICLKTNGPLNLKKFQKFVIACQPSNSDYKILSIRLGNKACLEMVKARCIDIQQSTLALITLGHGLLDINIQGHHDCVDNAKQQIEEIIKESYDFNMNYDSSILKGPNVETNELQRNVFSLQDKEDEKHDFVSLENNFINDLQDDNKSDSDGDTFFDERFQERIEQAIKCGYSEKLIKTVLKRQGLESSIDDMMRELVVNEVQVSVPDEFNEANLSLKDEYAEDGDNFDPNDSNNLRHIIIDGSNVAMSHGERKVFSCMGIKLAVDWFKNRGHTNITVFVPQWRKEASRPDAPISDQRILTELENDKILVFTPSRRVGSARIVCYDDRYVLQLAVDRDGIVVSNDTYRDLVKEKDNFRQVVEKRLLMYAFVQDRFMPPEDPLGRQGPILDNFLRIKPAEPKHKPRDCPYGRRCTYGLKCKFYHPERRYATPDKMVAEQLKEKAELKQKANKAKKTAEAGFEKRGAKQKLLRTKSVIPQEIDMTMSSKGRESDGIKKPVLHHSLSTGSSYLTEHRLKMEQAELSELFKPDIKASKATEPLSTDEMLTESKKLLSGNHDFIPQTFPIKDIKLNDMSKFQSSPNFSNSSITYPLNIPADDDSLLSSESNINPLDNKASFQQKDSNEYSLSQTYEIFFPPENPLQSSHNELLTRGLRKGSMTALSPPSDSNITYESMSGPVSQNYYSYPQPNDLSQNQHLQKAVSASNSTNMKPNNLSQRSFSLNVLSTFRPLEKGHAKVKMQSSLPAYPLSRQPHFIPNIAVQYPLQQYSHATGHSTDSGPHYEHPPNAMYSPSSPFFPTYNKFQSPPTSSSLNIPSQHHHSHSNTNTFNFSTPPPVYPPTKPPQYVAQKNSGTYMQMHGPVELQPSPVPCCLSNPHQTYSSINYHSQPITFQHNIEPEPQFYSVPANIGFNPNTPSSPYTQVPSPSFMSAPQLKDEDISVDDPRYSIYCQLSKVHGEKVVRTFMIRNPDIKNKEDIDRFLIKNLSSYKSDMGL